MYLKTFNENSKLEAQLGVHIKYIYYSKMKYGYMCSFITISNKFFNKYAHINKKKLLSTKNVYHNGTYRSG